MKQEPNAIQYSERRKLPLEGVLALYRANKWSSAQKPEPLRKALLASDSLVTAWDGTNWTPLGNPSRMNGLVTLNARAFATDGSNCRGRRSP